MFFFLGCILIFNVTDKLLQFFIDALPYLFPHLKGFYFSL